MRVERVVPWFDVAPHRQDANVRRALSALEWLDALQLAALWTPPPDGVPAALLTAVPSVRHVCPRAYS